MTIHKLFSNVENRDSNRFCNSKGKCAIYKFIKMMIIAPVLIICGILTFLTASVFFLLGAVVSKALFFVFLKRYKLLEKYGKISFLISKVFFMFFIGIFIAIISKELAFYVVIKYFEILLKTSSSKDFAEPIKRSFDNLFKNCQFNRSDD